MIVMLERRAVLPIKAENLCQMVPICSKCWVVLFAFLAKHCQCTKHHTKSFTDMRCSRLWVKILEQKHSTLPSDSATLWNLRNCPAIGLQSLTKAGQNKPVLTKKHMQKSKIYHIHNLILYSQWLPIVASWATNQKHMSYPVGSMLPTRIGSYWILWTDIAIDHLVFPMFIAVFFMKWLRQ